MGTKKNLVVEIDSHSGFCFGVVKAISKAEEELTKGEPLYCLGEIVHNSEEVERLKSMGLITINQTDFESINGNKVLFRAHGEPPSSYQIARERGIQVIDASCPVVLKLQQKVREGWHKMQNQNGQVVIFGKKGHAEVTGLVGHTNGEAIVIESVNEVNILDFTKPIELFAQTTMSSDEYKQLGEAIRLRINQQSNIDRISFTQHNSICGKVANRKNELIDFSVKHDVIVFVSGKNSSNGKMLYQVCKSVNPQTYFVSSPNEISSIWFEQANSVGVCGATSTPMWLMDKVKESILQIS